MMLFMSSVGLSVTMGLMGFVNLAHGGFAMVGGYVTVSAMSRLGLPFLARAAARPHRGRRRQHRAGARASTPASIRAGELDQVLLTIGLVFVADRRRSPSSGPAPEPVRLPDYLAGRSISASAAFRTYRVVLIVVGSLFMARASGSGSSAPARRPDPRRGRQPAHGPVGRHQRRPAVHRSPSPSAAAWRRSAAGSAIEYPRPVANLRDPISGALPDRGRGRRHGQPRRRLRGRPDPRLFGQCRQISLAARAARFFIYALTVVLLLARPEGLLARRRRG